MKDTKSNLPIILLATANTNPKDGNYLRYLPKELQGIRSALSKAEDAGLCKVELLPSADSTQIMDVFQRDAFQGRIAIFHFSGHGDNENILLETYQGENVKARGEGLSSFLSKQKGLQLVFLNACSTELQANQLVEKGLPAAIGTSKSIEDQVAAELAIRFYKGIANDLPIERAWKESQDQINTDFNPNQLRRIEFKEETSSQFPWFMDVRDGAESVKDWSLSKASQNLLWLLPKLKDLYLKNLPEAPFRYLKRYEAIDAAILFGRSRYIYDLHQRLTNQNSSPVLLLFGQSGVGKSSLLEAGLLPRLENDCEVLYIRRNSEIGLLHTFIDAIKAEISPENLDLYKSQKEKKKKEKGLDALKKLLKNADSIENPFDYLKKSLEDLESELSTNDEIGPDDHISNEISITGEDSKSIRKMWHFIEKASGKPLIIILDQVEELFTDPIGNDAPIEELKAFLACIKSIFHDAQTRPKGKLLLAYRKEFHPEILEEFKKLQIQKQEIFLQQLNRQDIIEVVEGLSSQKELKNFYRLSVDEGLSARIADDLLLDREAAIAPVLQILLTNMWNDEEQNQERKFTLDKYLSFKKKGNYLDGFIKQQLLELSQKMPNEVNSGLALDVLGFHINSRGNAAISRSKEKIQARYGDKPEVENLLEEMKNLYLLSYAEGKQTTLAHDTLAPIIRGMLLESDLPGQRADRILDHKVQEFINDPDNLLDDNDLEIALRGLKGMKKLSEEGEVLLEKSKKKRARKKRQEERIRMGAVLALIIFAFLSVWALWEKNSADDARRKEKDARITAEKVSNNLKIANQNLIEAKIKDSLLNVSLRKSNDSINELIKTVEIQRDNLADALVSLELAKEEALDNYRTAEARKNELAKAYGTLDTVYQEAVRQRERARNLYFQALGQTLAVRSLQIDDDNFLKGLLAHLAFLFNKNYNGPAFSSEIYNALYESLSTGSFGRKDFALQKLESGGKIKELWFSPANSELFYFISEAGSIYKGNLTKDADPILKNLEAVYTNPSGINMSGATLAISPDNKWLAAGFIGFTNSSAQDLSTLKLFQIDSQTGALTKVTLEKNVLTSDLDDLAFLQKDLLVTASRDSTIRFWKLDENKCVLLDQYHESGGLSKLAISPTRKELATILKSGRIKIHEMTLKENSVTLRNSRSIGDSSHKASSITFHPESNKPWIVYGNTNGGVFILNDYGRQTRSPYPSIIPLRGHIDKIADIKFSDKGQFLATISLDGTSQVWDIDSLTFAQMASARPITLGEFEADDWGISLSFSHSNDGLPWLMAGYREQMVKIWTTEMAELDNRILENLNNNEFEIKESEWGLYVGSEIKLPGITYPLALIGEDIDSLIINAEVAP